MAKPKLDDMMGAMGAMPEMGKEPAAKPAQPKEDQGDVSDEEMGFAEDMKAALDEGNTAGFAKGMKRFIKSCMAQSDAGEYTEPESPAEDMGDMQ